MLITAIVGASVALTAPPPAAAKPAGSVDHAAISAAHTAGAMAALGRRSGNVSDFSGDGFADVLAIDAGGKLLYYPNNGLRLNGSIEIGAGWQYMRASAADWSGDGYADVIAADIYGNLWYYPNNGLRLGAKARIGTGFYPESFIAVRAADWSADGYADVIAVDNSRRVWIYPHNGSGLGPRYQAGTLAPTPGEFLEVNVADWSGDGYADILTRTGEGHIYWYAHNSTNISGPYYIYTGGYLTTRFMDFSGDGYADMLGIAPDGKLWYYPHLGTGYLGSPQLLGSGWNVLILDIL